MATESGYRRVEEESREITSGKKSPTPQERAPPRPSDMPGTPSKVATGRTGGAGDRADVHITTDSRDKVHVDVDTHEGATSKVRSSSGAGGGWPKDGEEWKRLLSRLAPWLAAGAIVAASAYGYKKDQSRRSNGETLGAKVRRAGNNKVSSAAGQLGESESSKRGWFGFGRSRSEEAADKAAGELAGAKRAAGKKAEDAKGAVKRAADRASDKAADAAAATKGAARDATASAKGAAGRAADAAHGAAESVRGAATDAGGWVDGWVADRAAGAARSAKGAVKAGAERAEEVAEEAADKGFFLWKTATKGVKDGYRATKEEAKHLAGEAADTAAGAARSTADTARSAAHGAAEAARDAKDWTKEKAGDAVDAARRAEHAVGDTLYAGAAKVAGEAGAAEEHTGKAVRKAGERIETAGRDTKNYYRGEAAQPEVQPKKRRWLGIW